VKKYKITLSIVIPVFNEEENILILYREIISVLRHISLDSYEISFINDGNTLQEQYDYSLIRNYAV